MTVNLNEDTSGSKCQLNNMVQGTSREQKKEEEKPIKIEGVEEWKVEKILNKRKVRGVERYLV